MAPGDQNLTLADIRGEVQKCAIELLQTEIPKCASEMLRNEIERWAELLQISLQRNIQERLESIRLELSIAYPTEKQEHECEKQEPECVKESVKEVAIEAPPLQEEDAPPLDFDPPPRIRRKKSVTRVVRKSTTDIEPQNSYVDVVKMLSDSLSSDSTACSHSSSAASTDQHESHDVLPVPRSMQVKRVTQVKRAARFIFWTGGFDSTFRILQASLMEDQDVIPIYLTGAIDNFARNAFKRRSAPLELQAIHRITAELRRNHSCGLQDIVVVPQVGCKSECRAAMLKLHAEQIVRRRRCQYGAMAQLSMDLAAPVDVSVVEGDFLWNSLKEYLECVDGEWQVSEQSMAAFPELSIFRWLRFPLKGYSKERMLEEARQQNLEEFMHMTWTCWFPRKGGEPCQKCGMCKHRIV